MGAVKVKEINLERGKPAVDEAMRKFVNELTTAKRMGFRALVVVHGYGSSGVGGTIKIALQSKLKEGSLRGVIRDYAGGEEWINCKRRFIEVCPQLKDFSTYVEGNRGLTVILLKS
ncbi:Smr/MutS family protein [Aminipila terrae]|uniref:Smr domain-containing protein n=1 Tax=Aminipila terrae TaxID=2697030 RepID=A0A6P1MHN5_9FIRM|nr:Smr/MutS family protein [Aminipila terrae]QHI73251.1 hypothetical protein Ami3637_13460 [Aminipila terrae]